MTHGFGSGSYIDTDDAVAAATARMRAVREAVGPHVGIGLDFHGRVKLPMVKKVTECSCPQTSQEFLLPAGIDQALWDIGGKLLGVPVHQMLGGSVRTRLKAYRWCGGDENAPEESAAEATRVLATSNYKQLKMNACPRMG